MTLRGARYRTVCTCAAALLALAGGAGARAQASSKSIFVTVLDSSGKPVVDLAAADFAIREDGADREVLSAVRATGPLQIALLVDTSQAAHEYIHEIRAGVRAFMQDVLTVSPASRIGLWEFGQAAVRLKELTSDGAALDKEASRLYARPRSASVLLEGLYETSEALSRSTTPQRAIVSINIEPSDEQSRQEPIRLNGSLMKSRAQLWSLSVQLGSLRNAQRDVVLSEFVRNAGGVREYIVSETAIASYMRRFAAALTSQYEVTYARPSGRPQIVQTGVRRNGVTVVAGAFAPR